MTEILKPGTPEQLEEAISWAVAGEHPLTVLGNGTKAGLGKPMNTDTQLDVSGMSGIVFYEPEELVLRAQAGTPMSEIHQLLEDKNQQFMFEPIDYGPLFGRKNLAGTLGGLVATNLAGPRRLRWGAARDHVLGFEAVSGRGEAFKSGGRVMKNVSGFDLSKLMAGSFGTLGVMHTITMKTMPKDENMRTVLLFGADDATASTAMTSATASPHEVTSACHLPEAQAALMTVDAVRSAKASVTAIRVEGPGPSTDHRSKALQTQLSAYGNVEILDNDESRTFWAEIRDVRPFQNRDGVLLRLSTSPTAGPKFVAALKQDMPAEVLYDWAGGLVWLMLPSLTTAQLASLRQTLNGFGGHATLVRADEALRKEVPVFHPTSGAELALTQRIKDAFDPKNILNPGRMAD